MTQIDPGKYYVLEDEDQVFTLQFEGKSAVECAEYIERNHLNRSSVLSGSRLIQYGITEL